MKSKYYLTALLLVTFVITSCGVLNSDNDNPEWVGLWKEQESIDDFGIESYLDLSKDKHIFIYIVIMRYLERDQTV